MMAAENEPDSAAKTVREGKAEVFYPANVFYNPVQEYNRDLTVAVISVFAREYLGCPQKRKRKEDSGENKESVTKEAAINKETSNESAECMDVSADCDEDKDSVNVIVSPLTGEKIKAGKKYTNGIRILEGLSASGLRSIRFAREVPGVQEVVANDFDKSAVEFIERNIQHNGVEDLVKANCDDAAMVMYKHKGHRDRFDVIDLDPYGSPAVFLDSSVQAVKDGGLLIVTCTDLAILCGNASETCYSKYGAMSLKAKFCHEMALRIILQSIEAHANRYSRYIKPMLSISADFYIRVFVKVYTGQAVVKKTASKLAYVYHCTGCGTHTLQPVGLKTPTKGNNFKYTPAHGPTLEPKCKHCGHTHHVGGPVWADPIHDTSFVHKVAALAHENPTAFKTSPRIIGMLRLVAEELPDQPFYYVTDALCNVVHCTTPTALQIRSAIMNAGYKVSLSHACKNSLKTDAPAEVLWDIIRCWIKEHPINPDRLKEGTPAKAILDKQPVAQADFTVREDANPKSRQEGLLRFQSNPERNWGPKMKASRSSQVGAQEEKRVRLQNKRKKPQNSDQDLKQYACKRFQQNQCDLGLQCCYSHQEKNQDSDISS